MFKEEHEIKRWLARDVFKSHWQCQHNELTLRYISFSSVSVHIVFIGGYSKYVKFLQTWEYLKWDICYNMNLCTNFVFCIIIISRNISRPCAIQKYPGGTLARGGNYGEQSDWYHYFDIRCRRVGMGWDIVCVPVMNSHQINMK